MELRPSPSEAGERLDAFLAEPLGSRARAQRLIEAEAVRVDGAIVAKSHRVAPGEVVTVDDDADRVPQADPGERADFAVAFEDEHLLVVDKPAGVVVHPARGHWHGTLAQALEGRAAGGEDAFRAGIVHRLDRDTSGLLVVAKSDAVHSALKEALQRRQIVREYLALVEGRPPARAGTIDAPIGRDPRRAPPPAGAPPPGCAGGGEAGGGARRARGGPAAPRGRARPPRAGGGPPPAPGGHDRRAEGRRRARAPPPLDRHRRGARR